MKNYDSLCIQGLIEESKNKKNSSSSASSSNEEYDEEVEIFVNKLKRVIGKYKGKIPLKCFNCGEIGHLL